MSDTLSPRETTAPWHKPLMTQMFADPVQQNTFNAAYAKLATKAQADPEAMLVLMGLHYLQDAATKDRLTRLLNRTSFELDLKNLEEITSGPDYIPGAVVVVKYDLDHFKNLNDRVSHEAGDQLLREGGQYLKFPGLEKIVHGLPKISDMDIEEQEFARYLLDHSRESDCTYRVGGDEFISILDNFYVDNDALKARLDSTVEGFRDAVHDPSGIVSLSVGAARWHANEPAMSVLKRADDALYESKLTRNAASLWRPDADYGAIRKRVDAKSER
jgi:GGDEF domain-containing protein